MVNGEMKIEVRWATWDPETGKPETSWELKENCSGMATSEETLVTSWSDPS